ncbi:MAG: hypothetical protein IT339_02360 [Thermomicrobiales bacterium]|nr:hypothetical protein [Thermomicrobiales bacterium]
MSDRQRRAKQTARKPNRAQRKAQEVRQAETNAPAPVVVETAPEWVEPVQPAQAVAATPSRSDRARRAMRQKSQAVTYTIPRDVEYAYIRSDLRRLILTAGAMLVVMFVLLFLLD